jgi:hypothetical protein
VRQLVAHAALFSAFDLRGLLHGRRFRGYRAVGRRVRRRLLDHFGRVSVRVADNTLGGQFNFFFKMKRVAVNVTGFRMAPVAVLFHHSIAAAG